MWPTAVQHSQMHIEKPQVQESREHHEGHDPNYDLHQHFTLEKKKETGGYCSHMGFVSMKSKITTVQEL